MKKGRHRRYEEARALKQNQDLDLDAIFDSLDVVERSDEESPSFDNWADEYDDGVEGVQDDEVEEYEESTESA